MEQSRTILHLSYFASNNARDYQPSNSSVSHNRKKVDSDPSNTGDPQN